MRRSVGCVVSGLCLALSAILGGCGNVGGLLVAAVKDIEVERHSVKGEYSEAIPKAREALARIEAAAGPTHPLVAAHLHNLAELLRATGDYAAARPLYERALSILERAYGPSHLEVARSLSGLAAVLVETGHYALAKPALERALRIRERALGPNHADVGRTLSYVAVFLRRTGDYVGAKPAYERALRIFEDALGPRDHNVAATANNLAEILALTGQYAPARPLYERALTTLEQLYGPNHPFVALSLNNYGDLLKATGDHRGAKRIFERALRIHEQAFGPDHLWVVESLSNLAELLRIAGDDAAAKPLYERALPAARRTGAAESRWRAAFGLGRIHESEMRAAAALPLYREAVGALEELAIQLEERARARYLEADNRLSVYDALAGLLLGLHEQDPGKGYDGEAWAVLDAKKSRVVAEALAAARPQLADPAAREEAVKAQVKQEQVLALQKTLREERAKAPQDQRPEKIGNLTTLLARTKADYLAQVQAFLARYPHYRARFLDQQTVDPRALAKFAEWLPPGTLAVQYFASPDRLYLFLVAPGGRFRVKTEAVSQEVLYPLVRRYREHLEQGANERLLWADDGSESHRRHVLALKDLDRKLAEHLLGPVEGELQTHRNLIVIPNDLLLYLPFHALTRAQPDGSRRFLAETHAVSYLTQLELVNLLSPSKPGANVPLLALANPDGSLPGASREIRALVSIRPSVTRLEGPQATKVQFLRLAAQFPDLHLATHGVLDRREPERSYLLMAGEEVASQRLTVGEIAGLSLRNGLVILSACDTALGEEVPGAALITLAAAFSQAGSESIVASLWKVNDAATRDFMVAFHRALPAGNRAAALQQAQVAVIQNPQTAHPYYWAGFVLIGAR